MVDSAPPLQRNLQQQRGHSFPLLVPQAHLPGAAADSLQGASSAHSEGCMLASSREVAPLSSPPAEGGSLGLPDTTNTLWPRELSPLTWLCEYTPFPLKAWEENSSVTKRIRISVAITAVGGTVVVNLHSTSMVNRQCTQRRCMGCNDVAKDAQISEIQ